MAKRRIKGDIEGLKSDKKIPDGLGENDGGKLGKKGGNLKKGGTPYRASKKTSKKRGVILLGCSYVETRSLLSKYLKTVKKEGGSGRPYSINFNTLCSLIYKEVKGSDSETIEGNMPRLVKKYGGGVYLSEYNDTIVYYNFLNDIQTPIFENAEIRVTLNDTLYGGTWDFNGSVEDMPDLYVQSGLFAHLRQHYDSSPVAILSKKSQGVNKVHYEVLTNQNTIEVAPDAISKNVTESPNLGDANISKQIELEKIKENILIQQNIKLDKIFKLIELGFSKDEILKLI